MNSPVSEKPNPSRSRKPLLAVGIVLALASGVLWVSALRSNLKDRENHPARPSPPRKADAVRADLPQQPSPTRAEAGLNAGEAPPDPVAVPSGANPRVAPEDRLYTWKADEIYRFQYDKKIAITRTHEGQNPGIRDSTQTGILVFEVEKVDDQGYATALLRLDSPRVHLPRALQFDTTTNQTRADKALQTQMDQALEECLRIVKWHVRLSPAGGIQVVKREPGDLEKWLDAPTNAGKWSKRILKDVMTLIEKHLQMWNDNHEDVLFLTTTPSSAKGLPSAPLTLLRPLRRAEGRQKQAEDRLACSFARVAPPDAQPETEISIPLLNDEEREARIQVKDMSGSGKAILDSRLGMLDELEESYKTTMDCRCGKRKLFQEVSVTYKVNRIAPPIRKKANEDGLENAGDAP